jgi:hypothetical protein
VHSLVRTLDLAGSVANAQSVFEAEFVGERGDEGRLVLAFDGETAGNLSWLEAKQGKGPKARNQLDITSGFGLDE